MNYIIKLLFSFIILILLFYYFDFEGWFSVIVKANPYLLTAALGFFILQWAASTGRWRTVSRLIGENLGWVWSLQVFAIGYLFNQILPTSIGGDSVRVWFLRTRNVGWQNCVTSVFLDRLMALIGLAIIGALSLPFLADHLTNANLVISIIVGLALVFLVILVVILLGSNFAGRLLRRSRFFGAIHDIAVLGRQLFSYPVLLAQAVLWTLAGHASVIFIIYLISNALSAPVDIRIALIVVPPVMLLSTLPISFGGWGVREGAIVVMLTNFGIPHAQGLAIALLFGFGILIMSIPGAIFLWSENYYVQTVTDLLKRKKPTV